MEEKQLKLGSQGHAQGRKTKGRTQASGPACARGTRNKGTRQVWVARIARAVGRGSSSLQVTLCLADQSIRRVSGEQANRCAAGCGVEWRPSDLSLEHLVLTAEAHVLLFEFMRPGQLVWRTSDSSLQPRHSLLKLRAKIRLCGWRKSAVTVCSHSGCTASSSPCAAPAILPSAALLPLPSRGYLTCARAFLDRGGGSGAALSECGDSEDSCFMVEQRERTGNHGEGRARPISILVSTDSLFWDCPILHVLPSRQSISTAA